MEGGERRPLNPGNMEYVHNQEILKVGASITGIVLMLTQQRTNTYSHSKGALNSER